MAELQQRIKGYHQPYHRALRGLLDAAHRQHGVAYHLNCHSMNATSGAMGESGAGQLLAGMGFDVAVNHPFKGVERARAYADPAAGRHSLQLEINKRLYMDESALAPHAGFAPLQTRMMALLDAICQRFGAA